MNVDRLPTEYNRSSAAAPGAKPGRPGPGPERRVLALADRPNPSRAALRLLAALGGASAAAAPDPTMPGKLVVRVTRGAMTLAGGSHPAAAAAELARRDLVEPVPGEGSLVRISPAGRAHLARHGAAGPDDPFRAQHGAIVEAEVADGDRRSRVRLNAAESPLDWLSRRRDGAGQPLIEPVDREAGERLRADLTRAGLLPSVTARWDGTVGGAGATARDPAGAADAVIAARQRVRTALTAVGSDFADLLVDLCGFLKGLETIELERRWPPRSAKVVVRLALRRLAEHYGYEREARGPALSRGIRAWTAEPEPAARASGG